MRISRESGPGDPKIKNKKDERVFDFLPILKIYHNARKQQAHVQSEDPLYSTHGPMAREMCAAALLSSRGCNQRMRAPTKNRDEAAKCPTSGNWQQLLYKRTIVVTKALVGGATSLPRSLCPLASSVLLLPLSFTWVLRVGDEGERGNEQRGGGERLRQAVKEAFF